MDASSTRPRDPYDEAEGKVRKNIRRVIVLQSQVLEEIRNSAPETTLENTVKGCELLTVCDGIESDIAELAKVCVAIKANPAKYKIPNPVLDAREATIEEFSSKMRGIRERNAIHMATATNEASSSSGLSGVNSLNQLHTEQGLRSQETQLGALATSAANIYDKARTINMQVKSSNVMLGDLHGDMIDTQAHLGSLSKRMAALLDTNNPSLIRLVFMLCSIAVFLLVLLVVF